MLRAALSINMSVPRMAINCCCHYDFFPFIPHTLRWIQDYLKLPMSDANSFRKPQQRNLLLHTKSTHLQHSICKLDGSIR